MDIFTSMKESPWSDGNPYVGTFKYEGYPTWEEYLQRFEGYCGMGAMGDRDKYYYNLPVWTGGNVYFGGAKPMSTEADAKIESGNVSISLIERDGKVYIRTNLGEMLSPAAQGIISTETLGMAFEPEEKFEHPDGSPIIFDEDYFGNHRDVLPLPGPFASLADEIQVF